MKSFFLRHGLGKTYWIAYSGGLDSHVLLSMCHVLRQELSLNLRAIHVNHNLNPRSADWSHHCERVCRDYHIDLIIKSVQLDLTNGDSLEEVAREARYACFAECVSEDDVLLTAHQQDDQAETVLIQLFRGAGPKGLAAMPLIKKFAKGWHARPLLEMTRADLERYARLHALQWIEDESNTNQQLTRNFLRHDILPRLAARWPSVTKAISRSASHCAEAQELLEAFSLEMLSDLQGQVANTLSVEKLLALEESRLRLVLRTWIKLCGFSLPDTHKINMIRQDVLLAGQDSGPCLVWEGVELRRYRDDLYLLASPPAFDPLFKQDWDMNRSLRIPGVGTLEVESVIGHGLRTSIMAVTVGFRRGGERVLLPGRGRHELKNLFQEWGVPPWERQRVVLLFDGETCIAALGYFIDPGYMAESDEAGRVPRLTRD